MSKDQSYRIYLLAVCFVSVVCVAITSGIAAYSLLKLIAPEITLDAYTHNAHQSLDNFKRTHFYGANFARESLRLPGAVGSSRPILQSGAAVAHPDEGTRGHASDAEIDRLREDSYRSLILMHQRGAMQDLIRLSIVIFVAGVLFFLHWRLLRKVGTRA